MKVTKLHDPLSYQHVRGQVMEPAAKICALLAALVVISYAAQIINAIFFVEIVTGVTIRLLLAIVLSRLHCDPFPVSCWVEQLLWAHPTVLGCLVSLCAFFSIFPPSFHRRGFCTLLRLA